jgi:hypothetical protein
MSEEQISLRIPRSRALVLFEFLSRHRDTDRVSIEHPSEERVLWDLCADLERQLVEPFRSDYKDVLARARAEVAGVPREGDEAG